MSEESKALGWDTETVDNPGGDSDFRLLTPGEYQFIVTGLKRSQFNGSAKMCACPMAVVDLEMADDAGTITLPHRLYLNTKTTGLLAQFFNAIGLHKHGEPLRLDWSKIVGRQGWCRVENRVFKGTDGTDKTTNDVKRFLDPEKIAVTAVPQEEIPF